jgi:hypothetical protein
MCRAQLAVLAEARAMLLAARPQEMPARAEKRPADGRGADAGTKLYRPRPSARLRARERLDGKIRVGGRGPPRRARGRSLARRAYLAKAPPMSLPATVAVLLIAAAVAAVAGHQQRRPAEPGAPRLIPYVGLQIGAVVVVILMLAHLVALLSGHPFTGRFAR